MGSCKPISKLVVSAILSFASAGYSETLDFDRAKRLSMITAMDDNAVFHFPQEILHASEIWFKAEIPRGTLNKYEMRTATGRVLLDRVLCEKATTTPLDWSKGFPGHYGFSPGLFNSDGDPLDVVTIGMDAWYQDSENRLQQDATKVRVVGIVQMEECDQVPCLSDEVWEQDWKVLAVDPRDTEVGHITDVSELPENRINELKSFFGNYKGLKNGHAQTRVKYMGTATQAYDFLKNFERGSLLERKKELTACKNLVQTNIRNLPVNFGGLELESDKSFVKCLERTFHPQMFETRDTLDRFLKYSAYQLLRVKLKKRGFTVGQAFSKMQELRDARKKHYRFVGLDSASQSVADSELELASRGTGQVILEWVKTKNRNKGCLRGFPPQHYDLNPLIELVDYQ